MVKQNLCLYLSQNNKKPQNNLDDCIASTGLSNDFRRPSVNRATLTGEGASSTGTSTYYGLYCAMSKIT